MGIDQWEWEGMGILVFPHTSNTDTYTTASYYSSASHCHSVLIRTFSSQKPTATSFKEGSTDLRKPVSFHSERYKATNESSTFMYCILTQRSRAGL